MGAVKVAWSGQDNLVKWLCLCYNKSQRISAVGDTCFNNAVHSASDR